MTRMWTVGSGWDFMMKQIVLSCLIIPACLLSGCNKSENRKVESREDQDRRILLDNDTSGRTNEDFKSGATVISGPTMYVCQDSLRLRVDFDRPRNMVTVRTSDGLAYDLVEKPVSSGIWYHAEQANLRGPGTTLTWTLQDKPPTTCQIID